VQDSEHWIYGRFYDDFGEDLQDQLLLVFLALFQGLVHLLLDCSMKFVQKANLIRLITWCVLQPMSWDKYI